VRAQLAELVLVAEAAVLVREQVVVAERERALEAAEAARTALLDTHRDRAG
jgi:hypothetical protein